MAKVLLASVAALSVLSASAAHATDDTVPGRIIREWECDAKVSIVKDDGAMVTKELKLARANDGFKGTDDTLSVGNRYCDLKSKTIYGKKHIVYSDPGGDLSTRVKGWKD